MKKIPVTNRCSTCAYRMTHAAKEPCWPCEGHDRWTPTGTLYVWNERRGKR